MMTEEEREVLRKGILRTFTHGVDFGVKDHRLKILAVNEDYTKALIKVPGHTGWSGQGCTSYFTGGVYLSGHYPPNGGWPRHKQVFEVTRATPLTKKMLTDLMCEYLKPIAYTWEGLLYL